jgi:hypothetical protein
MGRKSDLEKDAIVQLENLTEEIRKVSQLGKAIRDSKLTQKALVILLAEMSNVSRPDIRIILNNLPLLEKEYLK